MIPADVYNGHGDVVQLTNASGTVIITYEYDAFGNQINTLDHDTNPFRYCGEYWDDETQTYYLRARYYRPSTGRFTQRDTYSGSYTDTLSLNRYTYCSNNPIKYKDPTGHWQQGDEKYTYEVQQKLLECTNAYNNATTNAAKQVAHAAANALRTPSNLQSNSKTATTVSASDQRQLNQVANVFNAALNSGSSIYVSPSQWNSLVSNTGIKTESTASVPQYPSGAAQGNTSIDSTLPVFTTKSTYVDSVVSTEIVQYPADQVSIKIIVTNKKSTGNIVPDGNKGIDTAAIGGSYTAESSISTVKETESLVKQIFSTPANETADERGLRHSIEAFFFTQSMNQMFFAMNYADMMYDTFTWAAEQDAITEADMLSMNASTNNLAGRYLNEALRQQNLKTAPNGLKQSWTNDNYKYEVRVHSGYPQYTSASSIYRVSRQQYGYGAEYLGSDGNWYHSSVLKEYYRNGILNPSYNANAAQITHIKLP